MSVAAEPRHLPYPAPIEAYGKGGFRFADMSHRGSLLCLPDGIWPWPVTQPSDITEAALEPVFARAEAIGLFLIGAGARRLDPAQAVAGALQGAVDFGRSDQHRPRDLDLQHPAGGRSARGGRIDRRRIASRAKLPKWRTTSTIAKRWCATADKDRFVATLFAAAPRRRALHALYAFNVELARVRDVAREPMPGEIRLQWWREVLGGTRTGEAGPVASALMATIIRYRLPLRMFEAMIEARSFDLYDDPMGSLAELEGYAEKTVVGADRPRGANPQ